MEIQQPNMYDDYSVSSGDEDLEYEPALPSEITNKITDNTSDSSSDECNEHNIMYNNRRKPSFVKKSLVELSTRINILPDKLKETMIIEKETSPSFCYIRHKVLCGLAIIASVIVSLIVIL